MNKAIFVDKDGTLIPDIPYNVDPDRITLSPGAAEALAVMQRRGFRIIVVSNQAGVAHGYFDESALGPVRHKLEALLAAKGIVLDDFYYCPHHPEGAVETYRQDCDSRKPGPGMLLRAVEDHQLDLGQSWMIGDILTDTEAGNRAGCSTILIEKPYDPMTEFTNDNCPDFFTTDWTAAGAVLRRFTAEHRTFPTVQR